MVVFHLEWFYLTRVQKVQIKQKENNKIIV